MARGKVKWFDPKKGYGFVVNENGEDVFVHYTNIVGNGFRCLKNGLTVEYREEKTDKGLQGFEVTSVDDDEDSTVSDDPQKVQDPQIHTG